MDAQHLAFVKEIDRIMGIDPLPPDWYYFPVVEIMTPADLIGVEFWPGFHRDCTFREIQCQTIKSTRRLSRPRIFRASGRRR
jgi:hypothetical protein